MRNKRKIISRILLLIMVIFAFIIYVEIKVKHLGNKSMTIRKDEDEKEKEITKDLFSPLIYTRRNVFDKLPSKYLPKGIAETDDRLVSQLKATAESQENKPKLILQYHGLGYENGNEYFKENCLVNTCNLTGSRSDVKQADAVIFKTTDFTLHLPPKSINQVWMIFTLESPYHSGNLKMFEDRINWTLTYRRDSTIVTPYFKYVPFSKQGSNVIGKRLVKRVNYAEGKTNLVAWFVSNCHSQSGRKHYVTELKHYINVDVYGLCGNFKCDRFRNPTFCEDLLEKDYKFYLGFENSKCKDYVTEKPYYHALIRNVVPVVLGASKEDYQKVLPPYSFIHVDDYDSPQALAAYLIYLDKNDDLYNEYFKWKEHGSFIETHFMCRVCAMLHQDLPPIWYEDVYDWWKTDMCNMSTIYQDYIQQ